MKLKIAIVFLAVLFVSACDGTEPDMSQAVPATPAVEPEKTAPVEQPVVEQSSPQESAPQTPQQPVVAVATQPLSGEAIYKKTCSSCHATGAANAPKLGDKAAWKPRIAKGMNVLLQSAINGVPGTAMMKRGTCLSCSDDDLKAVVEYMVSQSQ